MNARNDEEKNGNMSKKQSEGSPTQPSRPYAGASARDEDGLTTTSPGAIETQPAAPRHERDDVEDDDELAADDEAGFDAAGAQDALLQEPIDAARSLHGAHVDNQTPGQTGHPGNGDRNAPGLTGMGKGDYVDDDSLGEPRELVGGDEDSNVPGQPSRAQRQAHQGDHRAASEGTGSRTGERLNATTPGKLADLAQRDAGATTDAGTALQRENIPSGWNDVRFAGRVGYDYQWDRDEYMNALGVELSYVRRNLGTRLARLEVGATTSFLGEFAEDLQAYNFHGTLFPALEAGPVVFGPRGLLGGSWEDREKEVVIDAGGEGRLGVEAANYSVFVSAGRTINLTRVALDVGATF